MNFYAISVVKIFKCYKYYILELNMKYFPILLLAGGMLLFPLIVQAVEQAESFVGTWMGKLKISGIEMRLVFKINKQEDGTLAALMDSPDQGATDIPMDYVKLEGNNITMELKKAGGIFEGKLVEDGSTIKGAWKQGGMNLPLELKPQEQEVKLNRPQTPKKPYPYQEKNVTYENIKAGITLAGTLTIPQGNGPYPAVLLITGSGAQDRNETIMEHRPFLVIADYLTRRGTAVLRVDDRGVGGTTGNLASSTTEDLAGDVLTGVEFLKNQPEIDGQRIGLIGHSEGGIIAPIVAAKTSDISFIVLLAGTGLTGEEILYKQSELIDRAMGATEEELKQSREFSEKIYTILKQDKSDEELEADIKKAFAELYTDLSEEKQKEFEKIGDNLDANIKRLLSSWFRFFLTYDPQTALKKVTCPVLALIGEKDLQVPPEENLAAMEEALKESGNQDYTLKQMTGLNHLFQTADSGAPGEYGNIEETIAPEVLEIVADWIKEHTKK